MKIRFPLRQVYSLAALSLFAPVAAFAPISAQAQVSSPAEAKPFSDTIPWRLNMNDAREESKKTDKLLLIYFFADSSPECQNLEDTVFTDKRVLLLSEEFVSIPINGDGGPGSELMSNYGEIRYPLIPVVNAQQDVVGYLGASGGSTADAYAQEMAKLLEDNSLPRMKRAAATSDLSAMARLATLYTAQNKTNEAETLLEEAAAIVAKKPTKNERLAVANIVLADLYINNKDYNGSILMLEHAMAVAEKGQLVEAQLKLGFSLLEKGNHKDAKTHLQAVKDSPDASADAKELANNFLARI